VFGFDLVVLMLVVLLLDGFLVGVRRKVAVKQEGFGLNFSIGMDRFQYCLDFFVDQVTWIPSVQVEVCHAGSYRDAR
jgi:hypothetical protein